MPASKPTGSRWYPTTTQLKDPASTERSFRQVLDHVYSLTDQLTALQSAHATLQDQHAKLQSAMPKPNAPPPGSGPTDSMILGLRIAPVDTQTLADGTQLTWSKSQGQFVVK